jgi:chitin disaccharide deacetylase
LKSEAHDIQLIVNADDFGFNRDVNAGIIAAHRDGILTATTLMANGDGFEEAVELARATPSLDVGCHAVLVQGRSLLNPALPLPATLPQLARELLKGRISAYEEIRAQAQKIVDSGIRPSHIDTHKHTHLMPPVLRAVARVAREFGIRWVRRPFDFGIDGRAAFTRRSVALGMRAMAPDFARTLEGLRTTDHFTGFQLTGSLDGKRLVETLERLPEGLTEFMSHPGRLGPELEAAPTRLKKSREIELAALCSPDARRTIERRGIRLIRYRDLE